MEEVSLNTCKESKKENPENVPSRQNVSFKFSKQVTKRLKGNRLAEDESGEKYHDQETILSIEDKEIKGTINKDKEKKKKIVIQPIHKNVWRHTSSKSDKKDESSLEEQAVQELLKESAIENEKWENREFSNFTVTIPMVVQNRVPEGHETDDKLDVVCRPDESTLEDYENIPVDEYGAAVLRGLGYKPGDPVGDRNKEVVKPIEAVVRSKGLGLGADIKPDKRSNNSHVDSAELELTVGAYVHIIQGYHEGHYGQVESLNESRVIIKLTRHNKTVSLPHLFVNVVSKKEYKKESNVLNRSAYESYNRSYEHRNGQDSEYIVKHQDISNKHHRTHESSREDSTSKHRTHDSPRDDASGSSHKSQKKRKHSSERSSSNKSRPIEHEVRQYKLWVYPLLRVRFIDKEYKKGKYFNQKMTIEDVLSPQNVICKTEDGKCLDDIHPDMLETVIPRSESSYVMIVEGKYKGQLGTILKRDKVKCIATIHFLSDREKVIKIGYDSVCEYVGDISQFD